MTAGADARSGRVVGSRGLRSRALRSASIYPVLLEVDLGTSSAKGRPSTGPATAPRPGTWAVTAVSQTLSHARATPVVYAPVTPGVPASATRLAGTEASLRPRVEVAKARRRRAPRHRPGSGRVALRGGLPAERLALYPPRRGVA